ncbi:MAG: EamA family transporter, partial [Psittacicella sp.]
QVGITLGYAYASAKEVSIYSYSSIAFAAIFGFIFFNQIPSIYSFIGYGLIFIAGYWMFIINKKA